MKSVLISTQPKKCHYITIGKQTIIVNKTKPKLTTPFKCYIYCTGKDYDKVFCIDEFMHKIFLNGEGKQKVIGEFICDIIIHLPCQTTQPYWLKQETQIEDGDYIKYLGYKDGYGWHISNLKIYDKPKELSEFYKLAKCNSCKVGGYESSACIYDEKCKVPVQITRPPQSWCYVEEV